MKPQNSWSAVYSLTIILAATLPLGVWGCGAKPPPTQPETPQQPGSTTTTPTATPEGLLPLPSFKACASSTRSVLPPKWEATALMEDFFQNTLWTGKFVYDEGAQAFRFALADMFGVDLDFLVTKDRKLYLLGGAGGMPTSCELLTTTSPFTMPSREWLSDAAVCVGEAPLLQRDQRWWKNPSGVGANWFWFNASDGLPFRSMYYAEPTTPAPIFERFTFNYFPEFKSVPETNLARILEFCQSRAKTAIAAQDYAQPSFAPLLKKSTYPKPDAKTTARVKSWLPSVTECSSKSALPPPWPDQLQATAFLTAVSFTPNPFPTRIFYDWTKRAQNTTLYYDPPTPKNFAQTAYLLGDTGYITNVEEGGHVSMCQQVLPGPPVPDWKNVDGCECRGQIAPHSILNPSDVPTKILWCPTDLQLKQVFWTWYSDKGVPVVFMQSNSSPTAGTGLNLADYDGWAPGSVAPPHTFDLPAACQGQQPPPHAFPKACNNCHLPLNHAGAKP